MAATALATLAPAAAALGAARKLPERSSNAWSTSLIVMSGKKPEQKPEPTPRRRLDQMLQLPLAVKSTLATVLGALALPDGARAAADGALHSMDSGLTDFASVVYDNPLVVAAAVAVPTVIFTVLGKNYAGDVSPPDALKLLKESNALLLDVRAKSERGEEGSPSLKSVRKKPRSVPFEKEVDGEVEQDPAFADKVTALRGASPDSAILVLDQDGARAPAAASVLANADFRKVYVVKGGAQGWKESGLPWDEPGLPFKVDLGVFREALGSVGTPNVPASTLGVAAAAGISLLLLSEIETTLQLVGSAALLQIFLKRLLFAKDRKETLEQLQAFLDTKVAPEALVDDFKQMGSMLLSTVEPSSEAASKARDRGGAALSEAGAEAEAAASRAADEASGTAGKLANEVSSAASSWGSNGGAGPAVDGGIVPSASSTDLPQTSRPRSPPYSQVPDLKPPTSRTPSRQ